MKNSDKKNSKSTPKTTSAGVSDCLCGCCGSVPEYDEEDFIIEEENY